MAVAAHFVNKPDPEARDRYTAAFSGLDELGARDPGMASARNPLVHQVVAAGRHVDARGFLGQFVTLP